LRWPGDCSEQSPGNLKLTAFSDAQCIGIADAGRSYADVRGQEEACKTKAEGTDDVGDDNVPGRKDT
jgi:hypothetical protein